MIAVMTAQPPLPLTLEGARPVGTAAAIVEDDAGGRVFVHGNLAYAGTSTTPRRAGSRRCR